MQNQITKYKTITNSAEGNYNAKGSKFIAYAYPILNADEIKPLLETLHPLHKKARHFCYAYKIGLDENNYRANDDGEPSGSAGKPIYNKIRSFEVTNIFIVVVRYFGGTLLGVPGLIKAYGTAAEEALKQANIIEKHVNKSINIKFGYNIMNEVMSYLKKINANISTKNFDSICTLTFEIPLDKFDATITKLERIFGLEVLK